MRILVTGGYGFIGSNFIRHMLSNYYDIEIINIDCLSYGSNINNLKYVERCGRYRFIKGSICDRELVRELVGGVEAVVNFTAETHVDRSIVDSEPFFNSNTLGTFNLIESERRLGKPIRHLQVSTDEVYGDILHGSFREEERLRPSNPYSASKAAADMLCQAYHRTYGMDVIITRCTNNYGPYQYPEKLIPKTIIRALNWLQVPIYGTGRNIRDWIHVKDHCEALNQILERGRGGEIYNISSGNEVTNLEIVKEIIRILDKSEELITFVEDRPRHDIRYSLDSPKIRRELGWRPRIGLAEGLRETVNGTRGTSGGGGP